MKEFFEYLKAFYLKAILITPTTNSFLQFIRYVFVGGIATIADWGVLYIATESGLYYIISAVISFVVGLAVNFALSKLLVFKSNEAKVGSVLEFVSYGIIGLIGLGLTMAIMYVMTDVCGVHYMLSKVLATVLVLFWNYIARKKILYR